MHNDPDYFERPDEYIPERFLPGNAGLHHNDDAYQPFASGPRNCIGMRFAQLVLKLCMLQIYRKYSFEVCSQTAIPLDFYKAQVVMGPKHVKLNVIAR